MGEEEEKLQKMVQQVALAMTETIKTAIASGQAPTDQWSLASRPFKSEEEKESEQRKKLILRPKEKQNVAKKLVGFPTMTFLDDLYLDSNEKPIKGVPFGIQLGITGLPSSGKSILIEEIAIKIAHDGKHILLITSEDVWSVDSPRMDLENRCKQKADILGLDWKKIKENLFVMDAVTHTELREWDEFAQTYKYIVKHENIELVLMDSLTMLENYRGNLKYRLQELTKFNQLHGITAIYVNQRAKEEWDVREMAGGIGLGHILDSTLIIDYGRTYHEQIRMDLDVKRGVDVRIVRVLGCRLCGFDGRYKEAEITKDGFLRLKEAKAV